MIKWDHTFKLKRVFRQDDPLSPILFNIVVDMLAIIVSKAKEDSKVKGVVPNLIDGGLSILQYAYDTLFL